MSKFDIIEHIAMKFAATYYEAARSSGLKPRNPKHKTPRLWALHNFEKFLPKAIETCHDMLGRSDIHDNLKQKIYLALIERANDPVVNKVFGNKKGGILPELDLKKLLEPEGKKPIDIKTKPGTFAPEKSLKSKLKESISYG